MQHCGYVLYPVDLATNKATAAYGRREPRDVMGLVVTIHDRMLPLGAFAWADSARRPLHGSGLLDPGATVFLSADLFQNRRFNHEMKRRGGKNSENQRPGCRTNQRES